MSPKKVTQYLFCHVLESFLPSVKELPQELSSAAESTALTFGYPKEGTDTGVETLTSDLNKPNLLKEPVAKFKMNCFIAPAILSNW